MTVWYPAARVDATAALTYADYLCDLATEPFAAATESPCETGAGEFAQYGRQLGLDPAAVTALMATRFSARRDALVAKGRHPLVLFAVGRDESPVLHVALAEYLASYGFVVVSVPTIGMDTREMRFDGASLEANSRDLLFALQHVGKWPTVDAGQVAAIGYSFGSGTALLAAMRDPRVTTVISIDGAIGFSDRVELFRGSPHFAASRACVRLLHLNVENEPRNDLSLIGELSCSARTIVSMKGANHLDFSILGAAARSVAGFHHQHRGTSPESQARSHEVMCRYVLQFLRGRPIAPDSDDTLQVIAPNEKVTTLILNRMRLALLSSRAVNRRYACPRHISHPGTAPSRHI